MGGWGHSGGHGGHHTAQRGHREPSYEKYARTSGAQEKYARSSGAPNHSALFTRFLLQHQKGAEIGPGARILGQDSATLLSQVSADKRA